MMACLWRCGNNGELIPEDPYYQNNGEESDGSYTGVEEDEIDDSKDESKDGMDAINVSDNE